MFIRYLKERKIKVVSSLTIFLIFLYLLIKMAEQRTSISGPTLAMFDFQLLQIAIAATVAVVAYVIIIIYNYKIFRDFNGNKKSS